MGAGQHLDENKSARSQNVRKRPRFKAIMDDALSNKLDVVAVHKLDRFGTECHPGNASLG